MKKSLLLAVLLFVATVAAADNGTVAGNSKTYEFHCLGDIPVAEASFEESHFLGSEIAQKWNSFQHNYTLHYEVSVGLADNGVQILKPSIYRAVMRANKYVKKQLKARALTTAQAIEKMSYILDCANVIAGEPQTNDFENEAAHATNGEAVLALFDRVKLIRNN